MTPERLFKEPDELMVEIRDHLGNVIGSYGPEDEK